MAPVKKSTFVVNCATSKTKRSTTKSTKSKRKPLVAVKLQKGDVLAWHWLYDSTNPPGPILGTTGSGPFLRDGRTAPADGETLTHNGPLYTCISGLHASEKLDDACCYAPGLVLTRVKCAGLASKGYRTDDSTDKLVCRWRTILWRVDLREHLNDIAVKYVRKLLRNRAFRLGMTRTVGLAKNYARLVAFFAKDAKRPRNFKRTPKLGVARMDETYDTTREIHNKLANVMYQLRSPSGYTCVLDHIDADFLEREVRRIACKQYGVKRLP